MKKYRLFAVLLMLILGLATVSYATGEEKHVAMAVSSPAALVKAGEQITFFVDLEKNAGFSHMTAEIQYDPLVLTYVSHTFEEGIGGAVCAANVSSDGTIAVTVDAAEEGGIWSGTGRLMTVVFQISDTY